MVVATADLAANSGEISSPARMVGKAASAEGLVEEVALVATGDWAMAGVEVEEVRKAERVAVLGPGVVERAGYLHCT